PSSEFQVPRLAVVGKAVWAVVEFGGEQPGRAEIRPLSFELVGEAARLASIIGGEATAVAVGSNLRDSQLKQLGEHGADLVLVGDDVRLYPYQVETFAWVLARAIEKDKPWAVLFPATSFGRDLAPRVAAR